MGETPRSALKSPRTKKRTRSLTGRSEVAGAERPVLARWRMHPTAPTLRGKSGLQRRGLAHLGHVGSRLPKSIQNFPIPASETTATLIMTAETRRGLEAVRRGSTLVTRRAPQVATSREQ